MELRKKQAIGENLLYFMVWAAIILVPVLNSKMLSELHVNLENILTAWRKIAPYLIIFLFHNSLFAPKLLLKHRYWAYLICDLLFITLIFWIVDLYEENVVQHIVDDAEQFADRHKASFTDLEIYWNIVLGFFMTGANAGIKLLYQSIRDEQEMEHLKQQNLQAEMDYLKYQINPHFFMNTLNNIHALIDIDAESAKNAVIELSKMMRYVLYDSGRERISLRQDIQFLENYIALMRIRYTDAIDIRVNYPPVLPEISIPPLLLIVFVENAFKHGVSYNRSSFIHIDIACDGGMLVSRIVNSRHREPDAGRTGIGLENVRKRLDLIYGPKGYGLRIDDSDPATYTVQLEIPTFNA